MTEEEAKIVTDSVLEICRGGSLKGKDSSIRIKGEGKITTVLLKKLADAGLKGEADFSKEEWEGIRPLLPENFDAKAYIKCVTELTPIFLEKFSASGEVSGPDPKISSFQALPSVIKEGATTILSWTVQDASSVMLDQGLGNVPLNGSRTVSPGTTTIYTLSANREDITRHATTQVTVIPSTWEDKNAIGTLPGDEISYFKVLSYARDHLIAELTYRYNPQHGQVWIGGYLLDENEQSISRGFWPTAANPTGKTQIKVGVDPSAGRVQSKSVFFWLYESNKSDGFVSKRFPYNHYWN